MTQEKSGCGGKSVKCWYFGETARVLGIAFESVANV